MSSDRPTLRDRYAADLRSGSLPVVLTAVPLAMGTGLGSQWYWGEFLPGFLLLVAIGVLVPAAHDRHQPQDRAWMQDVLWTVGASLVAIALFAGSWLLVGPVTADPTHRAAVAFLATVCCGEGFGQVLGRRQ